VSLGSNVKRAIKATIIDEIYETLRTGFAVQKDGFIVTVMIGSDDSPTYFHITVKEKKSAHSIHSRDRN